MVKYLIVYSVRSLFQEMVMSYLISQYHFWSKQQQSWLAYDYYLAPIWNWFT